MVANEIWIIMFKPGKWTIVNGDSNNAHVVSVEHSVAETVALPQSNQFSGVFYNFFEHQFVILFIILLFIVGVDSFEEMIYQIF